MTEEQKRVKETFDIFQGTGELDYISRMPGSFDDRGRVRALFMDALHGDSKTVNLLMIAYDENIVDGMYEAANVYSHDSIEETDRSAHLFHYNFIRKLVKNYGLKWAKGNEIVDLWMFALATETYAGKIIFKSLDIIFKLVEIEIIASELIRIGIAVLNNLDENLYISTSFSYEGKEWKPFMGNNLTIKSNEFSADRFMESIYWYTDYDIETDQGGLHSVQINEIDFSKASLSFSLFSSDDTRNITVDITNISLEQNLTYINTDMSNVMSNVYSEYYIEDKFWMPGSLDGIEFRENSMKVYYSAASYLEVERYVIENITINGEKNGLCSSISFVDRGTFDLPLYYDKVNVIKYDIWDDVTEHACEIELKVDAQHFSVLQLSSNENIVFPDNRQEEI